MQTLATTDADHESTDVDKRILLVEDDDGDAGLVVWALKRQSDFAVTLDRARTLTEAIAACGSTPYDVVLLDLHLPGSDPLETVGSIVQAASESAIVVISDLDDKTVAAEMVLAGADDYLVKRSTNQNAISRSIRYASDRKRTKNLQLRVREEFLSHVSHELRTPLTSAMAAVELLQDDPDCGLSDHGAGLVAMLSSNLLLLRGMIGDLVDATMVRSGKLGLVMDPVAVESLVSPVVSAMTPLAVSAGIELTADLDEVPAVLGDRERLTQVLTNLVSNAIKYTPDGGTVTISGGRGAGGEVHIAVRDTGVGIPPEALPHLFDRLYQVPGDAVAVRRRGLGLGLFISKEIVDRHGGRLSAVSELGAGTTITLALPAPTG